MQSIDEDSKISLTVLAAIIAALFGIISFLEQDLRQIEVNTSQINNHRSDFQEIRKKQEKMHDLIMKNNSTLNRIEAQIELIKPKIPQ